MPCFELVMHLELLAEIWAKISLVLVGQDFRIFMSDIHKWGFNQ